MFLPALSFRLERQSECAQDNIGLLSEVWDGNLPQTDDDKVENNKCPQRCLTAESTRPAGSQFVLSTAGLHQSASRYTTLVCTFPILCHAISC